MSDSKLMRMIESRVLELPEGLLLAVLYGAACWAARQVSLDQFFLPAGIRVAALLLCRRDMWPYLLLGELAYFGWLRVPLIDKYGLEWVIISSAYQFPSVALVVFLHRRAIAMGTDTWLLTVAATSAVLIGVGTLLIAYALRPTPPSGSFITIAFRNTLGDYIAILTVAPLAMLWMRPASLRTWESWLRGPTIMMVIVLASMTGFALYLPIRQIGELPIQLLMGIPAIGLALLHGWRGVAVGVPALYFAVHLSTETTGLPGSFDPETFKNQVGLTLVVATLILFGFVVRRDGGGSMKLMPATTADARDFRFSQHALEMTLRRHVLGIRKIYEDIDRSVCDLADWLEVRRYTEMSKFMRQFASITSREMRDRSSLIYPTSLEHVGLYLALQVDGVGQEWRSSHRVAEHQLSGDPCQLSMSLQLAAYRTITEAMSLMLDMERGPVRLRARCGRLAGRRGVVIVIGLLDVNAGLSPQFGRACMKHVSGVIAAHAGRIDCEGNRVRMSLVDVDDVGTLPRP